VSILFSNNTAENKHSWVGWGYPSLSEGWRAGGGVGNRTKTPAIEPRPKVRSRVKRRRDIDTETTSVTIITLHL